MKNLFLIISLMLCLPVFAENAYSRFDNPKIYQRVLEATYEVDRLNLTYDENRFERFYFALDSLELKKTNPKYLKRWEKRLYGEYLKDFILYSFINIATNADEEYKEFTGDMLEYNFRRLMYYKRSNEYMDKEQFRREVTSLIEELDSKGMLDNYKAADLISYNLFRIMLYNGDSFFVSNNGDNAENDLTTLIIKITKHNDNKSQAKFNSDYYRNLMYCNRDYFEAYHDKNFR